MAIDCGMRSKVKCSAILNEGRRALELQQLSRVMLYAPHLSDHYLLEADLASGLVFHVGNRLSSYPTMHALILDGHWTHDVPQGALKSTSFVP